MAVIEGITANVIVDGDPLEEFNKGDDDDDQKYIDNKKALQDLVTSMIAVAGILVPIVK